MTEAPEAREPQFASDPSPVPLARSADVERRSRTYVITMMIRMVCLALLIVVPGGWKLVMLVGAVVLPMVAVLVANDQAVPGPARPLSPAVAAPDVPALEPLTPSAQDLPPLVLNADGTLAPEDPPSHTEDGT